MLRKLLGIISQSFFSATKGGFWKWSVGSVGGVLGILLFGKNFLGTTARVSSLIGLGVFGFLFLLRFAIFLGKNLIGSLHYKYVDSIYGDAIILLKDAFARVHYLRKQPDSEDVHFMETMILICNCLKEIFDKKTKADCSVSIKIPISGRGPISETSILMNLCRDTTNSLTRDTEAYKKQKHTILGNTAYTMIVNKALKGNRKLLYYVNNNIETTKDYLNTSREVYPGGKLPYKSELVIPITPIVPFMLKSDKNEDSIQKYFEIWGFLCVDCTTEGKFDEKYDLAIVEGVADGVVDVIINRKSST